MSSFRIRPRFKQLTKESSTQLQKRMLEKIDKGLARFSTTYVEGHITLAIPTIDRHFWSPQLSLSFEETKEGTVIRGLYGPNPTVWAIFFFGYIALGILALFALMAGSSQWMLGMGAPILWVIPVCAIVALVMYFVAQAGQKMGAEEMYRMHHFYEDTVGSVVHIE
ncbi:MAG: hypothetical protein RIF33_13610 [Cyclobacteriaceae bacterium]